MDRRLSHVLAVIETEYNIPILQKDLDDWVNESQENKEVYDAYKKLADIKEM